jgi:hypothetical protein
MNGLAVVLFASYSGFVATDEEDENKVFVNTGTKYFINCVNQCISEGKLGLEFIDKY